MRVLTFAWRCMVGANGRYLVLTMLVLLGGTFLFSGCASTNQDGAGRSIYLTLIVNRAANTVQDLLTVYGPLPTAAADAVTATRDYAEGICAVMTVRGEDGVLLPRTDLTPEQRILALQDGLAAARTKFDEAEAALLDASDMEPAVRIAVGQIVGLTRDVFDVAVSLETDPAWFVAPCDRLNRIPRIISGPQV